MNKKAFTIIELIVVVSILTIILVVGVVNLRSAGTVANDEERKTDVSNFAKALEDYYLYGTTSPNDPYNLTPPNEYPDTSQFGTSATNYANLTSILSDFDTNNVTAPGVTTTGSTLVMATNNVATTAGITPQPTTSQYVYQPISSTGSLCTNTTTQNCRKFYIYYKLESDSTVYQLASKNK